MQAVNLNITYIPIFDMNELENNLESIDDISVLINEEFHFNAKQEKRIKEIARVITSLIDETTEVDYSIPKRSETEFIGGYKIAIRRGAGINTAKALNMNFRYKKRGSRSPETASMLMINNDVWILIFPDNTGFRIEAEKETYLKVAKDLVLIHGLMEPDEQNNLIINLQELNLFERCAQSFLHEYGHILHWEQFKILDFDKKDTSLLQEQIYQWFYETGYLTNVDKRFPKFGGLEPSIQIELLKESLAEDYRISLNIEHKMKYILPNSVCHRGDLVNPKLLMEGIEIMTKMIKKNETNNKPKNARISIEKDRIILAEEISNRHKKNKNWVPGEISLPDNKVKEILKDLKEKSNTNYGHDEAACTKEE